MARGKKGLKRSYGATSPKRAARHEKLKAASKSQPKSTFWSNLFFLKNLRRRKRAPRIHANYRKKKSQAGTSEKVLGPSVSLAKTTKKSSTSTQGTPSSIPFFSGESSFVHLLNRFHTYRIILFKNTTNWQSMVVGLVLAVFVLVTYLSFFDRFFLIRDYDVEFASNSFLSEDATKRMLVNLQQEKFLSVLPYNQYWFINDQNLTLAAQRSTPEVSKIEILERTWPNKIRLRVHTDPILVTLNINQDEYWRVSTDGRIASRDDVGLRQQVVVVESPLLLKRADILGYQILRSDENTSQYNRFWYINWLWKQLDDRGIDIARTSIRSLTDQEVVITLSNGTDMLFHPTEISQENQLKRIEVLADTQLGDSVRAGEYEYIDMRFPRRIFVCAKNDACA